MKKRSIAQAALQEAKQVREHMTSHLRAKLEEEQLPLLQQLVEQALVQEEDEVTADEEFDLDEAVRSILKESDDEDKDDEELEESDDDEDDDESDDDIEESEDSDDDTDEKESDDEELEESIQSLLADLREEMYGDDDELMVDNEDEDDFYDDEEDDADFLEVYENRKLIKVEKALSETKLALHKMVSLHSLTVNEGIKGSRYSKLLDVLDECTSIKQVDFLVKSTRSVISEQKIANDAKRALNEGSSTVIKTKKANKSSDSEFGTAYERMRRLGGISGE